MSISFNKIVQSIQVLSNPQALLYKVNVVPPLARILDSMVMCPHHTPVLPSHVILKSPVISYSKGVDKTGAGRDYSIHAHILIPIYCWVVICPPLSSNTLQSPMKSYEIVANSKPRLRPGPKLDP